MGEWIKDNEWFEDDKEESFFNTPHSEMTGQDSEVQRLQVQMSDLSMGGKLKKHMELSLSAQIATIHLQAVINPKYADSQYENFLFGYAYFSDARKLSGEMGENGPEQEAQEQFYKLLELFSTNSAFDELFKEAAEYGDIEKLS